ncbi:nitric oxide reductase activation protein NorD [Desulfogranum japonicum]|uniref:nitric oxide reductase activation protein NorD n=1 Tax=Desulfogranum japonicum TaxID=231447 RepID=UPI00041C4AF8|nr:VWA domain-containing protein [Desulfogranum japonicum]
MQTLTKRFYELVYPSLPNEWDVEESLTALVDEKQEDIDRVMDQVPVVWSVSHSLCFAYLSHSKDIITHIAPGRIAIWIRSLLDQYETGGLRAARIFIDEIKSFTPLLNGYGGLTLEEAAKRLQPYVNGLHGREMLLIPSSIVHTDTASIYLPPEIKVFHNREQAFLLYKFIVSYQWATVALKSLHIRGAVRDHDTHPLEIFFHKFEQPDLIRHLFLFWESVRVESYLRSELPGLMQRITPLISDCYAIDSHNRTLLETLHKELFTNQGQLPDVLLSEAIPGFAAMVDRCQSKEGCQDLSISLAARAYELIPEDSYEQYLYTPPLFQGQPDLDKIVKVISQRKAARKQRFIEALATLLLKEEVVPETDNDAIGETAAMDCDQSQADQAMVLCNQEHKSDEAQEQGEVTHIVIDNEEVALSEELAALTREILEDYGHLPTEYVSSAAGKAGAMAKAPSVGPDAHDGDESKQEPMMYDEWDFRRKGYRKNWCVLTEKELAPVSSTFISDTLEKYQGHIYRLRYQFEQLQTVERFVRRQRDGDDIDVDALIEAIADRQAGYPPSDRVFIRLQRDERDIAVYFLVDMSNSTEGWVGRSIKEALVLICEAMEMLDDRYAIYGFSGMRRLRCEMYPVKGIQEPYSVKVRERIAAIGPKEYTRMAPAIRHTTSLLAGVEARLKLMILLTDGKPEDYDDYKGDYAIEDTRHALFEAKAAGIHPFGITIDKHAQDYMAYMYGPANYIFVDNIQRLPALMPEIYRGLTS